MFWASWTVATAIALCCIVLLVRKCFCLSLGLSVVVAMLRFLILNFGFMLLSRSLGCYCSVAGLGVTSSAQVLLCGGLFSVIIFLFFAFSVVRLYYKLMGEGSHH